MKKYSDDDLGRRLTAWRDRGDTGRHWESDEKTKTAATSDTYDVVRRWREGANSRKKAKERAKKERTAPKTRPNDKSQRSCLPGLTTASSRVSFVFEAPSALP